VVQQGATQLSLRFPAGLSMVSLPLAPDFADPARLGFKGSDWARWYPATREHVTYTQDPGRYTWFDDSRSVPQKGYWARFSAARTVTVSGVPPSSEEVVIPVDPGATPGWVQIGCPFPSGVSWRANAGSVQVRKSGQVKTLAEARAAGWCEDFLWGHWGGAQDLVYDRTISVLGTKDGLEAGHGYWFYAYGSCELILGTTTTSSSARSEKRGETGWLLPIMATTGGSPPGRLVIGQSEDPRVIAAPPSFGAALRICSVGPGGTAAVDLRPSGGVAEWDVSVATASEGTRTRLTWPDLSQVPGDLRPVLVDTVTKRGTYMRTTTQYEYTAGPAGEARVFRVEMAKTGAGTLQVTALAATQSGEGSVDVRVGLSSQATVDVEVLNIAGRRVAAVCSGKQCEAGLTALRWSGVSDLGTRAPRGRYLVKVIARDTGGMQTSSVTAVQLRR